MLFVHGGGEGAHEADERLAASLQEALGDSYEVRCPKMPNEASPEYGAWKDRISEELARMGGGAILVGHSFGASVLVKYLSEVAPLKPTAGLFLVATPLWGAEDWEVDEYALPENFASTFPEDLPIFFYHSRDDEVVPFGHLALYAERFPWATFRELDGRGHQLDDDLSEVALDIRRITTTDTDAVAGATGMNLPRETDLPAGLARPARRALVGAGYRRLEQLARLREPEVGRLHGMGPKALGCLRRALAARGLSFADEGPNRLSEEDA